MRLLLLLFLLTSCAQDDLGSGVGNSTYNPLTVPGTQVGVLYSYADDNVDRFFLTLQDGQNTRAALDATGQSIEYAEFVIGPAPCKINGVGMPAEFCFADPSGRYWAFFYKRFGTNSWEYADVGIGPYVLQDGDLIGLLWTAGDPNNNYAPIRTLPNLKLADLLDN